MLPRGFRSLFRGRASPAVASIVLVVLFVASGLQTGVTGAQPAVPHAASPAAAAATVAPSAPAGGAPSAGATRPAGSVQAVTGTFFENDTTFANLPANRTPCGTNGSYYNYTYSFPPYTYYDSYHDVYKNCYQGAQNPSTVSFGGNHIGVGYSVLSNQSMVGCSNHPDVETSQVAFEVSSNAGLTFSKPVWIGNTSCAYLQALEPSFTLSPSDNDTVFGAFVEANYGNATNITFPFNFANRTDDALAFTESKSDGKHFSNPVTLTLAGDADIARPEIAAFGKTVYIVYEDLDNNSSLYLTNVYPYPSVTPISLQFVESTDGGATWHGPYTLPGLNASAGYNAMSASIAVSSTGTVAVAYATNRSCFELLFGYCYGYGDQIVVSTSTTNGTSWGAPVPVSPNATGEYQCYGWDNQTGPNYYYGCYAYMFQWEPSTSIVWSTVHPGDVYVAWSGEWAIYNASDFSTFYAASAVFSAASNDSGASWNDSVVALNDNPYYPEALYYNPVINDRDGWVYVSWAEQNDSYCFNAPCGEATYGSSYWLDTSHDGLSWGTNVTLLDWCPSFYVQDAFTGYSESMGFSAGGPVVTFSVPYSDSYSYGFASNYSTSANGTTYWFYDTFWDNTTGFADLTTAFVWSGNTTTVNFTETGLPSGTRWSFSLGSATFNSTAPTIEVKNVPEGPGLYFSVPDIAHGFWSHYTAFPSVNGTPTFNGTVTNVTVAFIVEWGITFGIQPTTDPFFDLYFQVGTNYYDYYDFGCPTCIYEYPEFPWYFPTGTNVSIVGADYFSAFPVSYWSGTGNGSTASFGNSTTFQVDGVINETAWMGAFGSYNVTFVPQDLASGTPYSFTFDGAAYAATAPTNVTVANVVTGAYTVGSIQANDGGGFESYGEVPGGDTVYIPASPIVDLNFSYATVDLNVAPGAVSFQASGLATGDPWQLSFNGTTYASSTPWINVSTRPGTFALSAFPVQAAYNDTAEYTASGVGPTLSVTLGSTYTVTYSPTYRVAVVAGAGGTVVGSGSHWLAPGTQATYAARPDADYTFLGWTGTGAGSYTGTDLNATVTANAPITESASFEALPSNRFNLTVNETGLASGVAWTVELNGVGYTTTTGALVIPNLYPCSAGAAGDYAVNVPTSYPNGTSGVRFVPSGVPGTVCTTGTTRLTIAYTEEFLVTPFTAGGGSAAVEVHGAPSSAATWVPADTTASLEASPDLGYNFFEWVGTGPGSYTGPDMDVSITPTGPITEVAYFTAQVVPPPATYAVSFQVAGGLPAGTAWSLTLNGTHYSSTTPWINATGYVNGSYTAVLTTSYSADRLSEFVPAASTVTVTVNGGPAHELVSFNDLYWVEVSSTPGGTVNAPAGSGYVASGKTLSLNATPIVGYSFVGWTGTGAGSYTGTSATGSVIVNGPVTEVASFAPIPPAAPASSGVSPSSTGVIAALAVGGLVVGLGVGYVVFRRRAPPPGGPVDDGGSA